MGGFYVSKNIRPKDNLGNDAHRENSSRLYISPPENAFYEADQTLSSYE